MKKITPLGLISIGFGWIVSMLFLFHLATVVHPTPTVAGIALFFLLIVTPLVYHLLYKNTASSFINKDRNKLKKHNESVRQQLLNNRSDKYLDAPAYTAGMDVDEYNRQVDVFIASKAKLQEVYLEEKEQYIDAAMGSGVRGLFRK